MKKFVILFILFILFIFVCAYSYVNTISANLYNNIFRLHVIANSDTVEDQNLKYIVRDELVNYMNSQNFSTKEDAIKYAKAHCDDLKEIAESTIRSHGVSYPVCVEIGNFQFPTKTYGDISFPSGSYDALEIKLGKANGQNWWCVMFPPLCFVDTNSGIVPASSKETLKQNLSSENYMLVSETEDSDVTIKFKIVEFFQKAGLIASKK